MSLFIYLLGVVDNLVCILGFVLVINLISFMVLGLGFLMISSTGVTKDEEALFASVKKWFRINIIVIIISSALGIFTPSSKTLAAMYLVPRILENKTMQNLPEKLEKIVNLKLDNWIDDYRLRLGGIDD
jgi:hypothetical protein